MLHLEPIVVNLTVGTKKPLKAVLHHTPHPSPCSFIGGKTIIELPPLHDCYPVITWEVQERRAIRFPHFLFHSASLALTTPPSKPTLIELDFDKEILVAELLGSYIFCQNSIHFVTSLTPLWHLHCLSQLPIATT